MRRRWYISIAVLVVVALIGMAVIGWWGSGLSGELLSFEDLKSQDPQVRLRAANSILKHEPRHDQAAMVRVRALIELGQYGYARDLLIDLEHQVDKSLHADTLTLYVESCLSEADAWITNSTVHALSETADRFEVLINEANEACDDLRDMGVNKRMVERLRVRGLYVRASMLRLRLRSRQEKVAKANAVELGEPSKRVDGLIQELEEQVASLHAELVELCHQLLESDPSDPWPRRLLFQMRVDTGDLEGARLLAEGLVALPRVEASLAGRLANVLLNLEALTSRYTSQRDVEISRKLLDHQSLVLPTDTNYRLASARLALRDGRNHDAEKMMLEVLETHKWHPTAACLLARALIAQGHSSQAVDRLVSVNQRVRSVAVRFALGEAMLAAGDHERGREMLRQCLEIQPDYLPAVLQLVGSLVASGYTLEAERDIRLAIEINAEHPEVQKLWILLLVEKLDREGILHAVNRYLMDQSKPIRWQDVALGAAMVVNDVPLVSELIEVCLAEKPDDALALLGYAWLQADPVNRFEVAGILVRALLEYLDADPFMKPVSVTGHLQRKTAVAQEMLVTPAKYVGWPSSIALEVIQLGLERWLDQPTLLDLGARLSLCLGKTQFANSYVKRLKSTGALLSSSAQAVRDYLINQQEEAVVAKPVGDGGDTQVGDQAWVTLLVALDREDDEVVKSVLTQMLTTTAWPEWAVLLVMRDWAEQGRKEDAFKWLAEAQKFNQRLVNLTRSRLNIALGQSTVAAYDLKKLLQEGGSNSELRLLVSDVLVRERLASGNVGSAVSLLEDLALSIHDQRISLRVAALDILMKWGEAHAALISLMVLINDDQMTPRWRDEVLARALVFLDPGRFESVIDELLAQRLDDPLLVYYKGLALAQTGNAEAAEQMIARILESKPNAMRAVLAMGRLAGEQGRVAEAKRLYRWVIEQGGRVVPVAEAELVRMTERAKGRPVAKLEEANP